MKQALACDYKFEFDRGFCLPGFRRKTTRGEFADRLDVWICLIPMLPFHYVLYYR